jgi:hypothetical protein
MRNLRRFFSSWQNILSLMIIATFATLALAAPWISPMARKDPGIFQRVGRAVDYEPKPPNEKALLGTLPSQYDIFHALVWGTGEALRFGLTVATISALVGIFLGAVAGYAGGFVNSLIMRITDAFLAFPVIAGVVFLQQLVNITIVGMGGVIYINPSIGKFVDIPTSLSGIQAFLQRTNPLLDHPPPPYASYHCSGPGVSCPGCRRGGDFPGYTDLHRDWWEFNLGKYFVYGAELGGWPRREPVRLLVGFYACHTVGDLVRHRLESAGRWDQ